MTSGVGSADDSTVENGEKNTERTAATVQNVDVTLFIYYRVGDTCKMYTNVARKKYVVKRSIVFLKARRQKNFKKNNSSFLHKKINYYVTTSQRTYGLLKVQYTL